MTNVDSKYKIRAWELPGSKWEAQFIYPPNVGEMGIVETGRPERLGKIFSTEKEANQYAFAYLKKIGVTPEQIYIIGEN